MEIGISTACFYPMQTEQTLEIIAGLGASVCEVFFEAECEYEPEFTSLIKDRLTKYNIKPNSVHAFCAPFEAQLFSDYERRRKDALKSFEKVLKAASALGCNIYTFHGDKRADDFDSIDFAHYGKCFDLLANMACSYGVQLAWENVAWCQSSRPEFIKRIKEITKSTNLKHTLDIKQAKRAGISPYEYIEVMGEGLVNLHLNDNNDTATCLLPGEGTVDFSEYFDYLKQKGYRGNAIIEVYNSNYKSLDQLKTSFDKTKKLCLKENW
ncbi:MAG: sugar phosphate isomerase/epimerase [Eubacteriales bacterium]|jgi:sugar phosphate isomerase/epimerase|nr:sugar phosphate isomerase/epimerase [Eubacteriales bacterium]